MPTYEYACRDCGEHVEVVQSFKDDPLETCGVCGGSLRKVFSAAGIIFKGSGYYVTDSRASQRQKSEGDKAEKKDAGAASSSSSTGDSGKKTGSAEAESA